MGFESLPTAILDQKVVLTPEEVAFSEEMFSDEVALSIVLQDVSTAEKFVLSKSLHSDWEFADNMYRAFVQPRTWPGTEIPRANIGMPIILETIEKVLPAIYLAFFSDKQPFLLEPTGRTTPQAARAREKVLLWAINQAEFKEEIRKALKSALLYGLMIGKYGWKSSTKTIKTYKRKAHPATVSNGMGAITVPTVESDEVEKVEETYDINHPTFENVELRNVLVDPGCRGQDCRKAKYIINQVFVTADDLDTMREMEGYKSIPTRDELALILSTQNEPTEDSLSGLKVSTFRQEQAEPQRSSTTLDPLKQPLELLEYWSEDRVITVLQRRIVIRNEQNEFARLPFVSCCFIDVPGSFYGFGISKLLSGEQRFQQGVINSWIDTLTLQLNPTFQLQKGIGPGTQQIKISPGKVVNESGELKQLVMPSVTTEAMNAIQTSEARATRRVGANGGSDMPTQALRTAEGVQSFSNGIVEKLQYFIEVFTELVFVPTLEAFVEMCNDHLKPSQINAILSEQDGKAYEGDVLEVYNGTCNVTVLSSTKLTARRAAVSIIPMLVQLLSAQSVQDSLTQQGKKFDYAELLTEALDLTGWSLNSLIVDMTDDDLQRAQTLTNPAAVKATSDQQKAALQHEFRMDEIQEQGMARAGVQVVRHMLTQSDKQEVI